MADGEPWAAGEPWAWPPAHRALTATRLRDGASVTAAQDVAEECAVSVEYNGVPYAVMMATPSDIEDFGVGFTVTERLARGPADIRAIATRPGAEGITLDITLGPDALRSYLALGRARMRPGHAGCGICGAADAATALAPGAPVGAGVQVTVAAIHRALAELERAQVLNHATHAVHAAGWATAEGALLLSREDVGRHNALDKLIGAGLRSGMDFTAGLCVITSRCSVEMAQKAVIAGMPVLAGISGPTALAVRRAEAAGLTLVGFTRGGSMSVYAGLERIGAVDPRE